MLSKIVELSPPDHIDLASIFDEWGVKEPNLRLVSIECDHDWSCVYYEGEIPAVKLTVRYDDDPYRNDHLSELDGTT